MLDCLRVSKGLLLVVLVDEMDLGHERVSVTPLTSKLMHMPHTSAQSIDYTVAAANDAVSLVYFRLSCSYAVTMNLLVD